MHSPIDDKLLEVEEIFQRRDACYQGEWIIHVETLNEVPNRVATATSLAPTTTKSGTKPSLVAARRKASAFLDWDECAWRHNVGVSVVACQGKGWGQS